MLRLYVGSVNAPNPWFRAMGEGVTVCELDETTGSITRVASHPEAENAMWMVKTRARLLVATECANDGGEVGTFDFALTRVGPRQKTPGSAICHLALSPDAGILYAVSYLGGVTVHAIDGGGVVSAAHQTIAYEGASVNADRQERSHPHQAVVSPDGGFLFVCDLGCDKVWIHRIEGSRLGPAHAITTPSGCGPRHLVFHPQLPRFYLLGELDAAVHVYEGRNTDWTLLASHSALPIAFTGTPAGGGIRIHPCGKSLAVSERGSNTIAVFRIDDQGELTLAKSFSTLGKCPRDFDFTPSGRNLVVLNQDSDTVFAFAFDPADGLPTGQAGTSFSIGCPVCVIF